LSVEENMTLSRESTESPPRKQISCHASSDSGKQPTAEGTSSARLKEAKVATRGFSYKDSLVGASYLNQRMAEDCLRDDYSSEDDDEDFGDEDCPVIKFC
jgi:hypothetical protein